MRILVFGDSIVYGSWDSQGGWVERLKKVAHAKTLQSQGEQKTQVLNLGIGGDTSTKILKRLDAEITARFSPSWPFAFVFSFGANDERTIQGKPETSLEEFKQNAQAIIDIAKKHSQAILFVAAPPLSQPEVMFKGVEYSDERIVEYQDALQEIVEAAGIKFVDVREALEAAEDNIFSYDGLHPNDLGHQIIAEVVGPELEELTK